jgi:hypothetical protein
MGYETSLDEDTADEYTLALLSLTDEEAEHATGLERDEFWEWLHARA